jgi:hypothetical protein
LVRDKGLAFAQLLAAKSGGKMEYPGEGIPKAASWWSGLSENLELDFLSRFHLMTRQKACRAIEKTDTGRFSFLSFERRRPG